jgi:hypothetical protein
LINKFKSFAQKAQRHVRCFLTRAFVFFCFACFLVLAKKTAERKEEAYTEKHDGSLAVAAK